ncbi:hypothetical protein FACS189416_2110 [Bacteroidia bacterium]|nr:hypothetical protein FACS189416_2110 [Bacteroidia bacterium]
MKKYNIFHIYYGTQGNGGLYLDEIYSALNFAGFKQKVFVSYYYPFNYGEKVFFRKTDLMAGGKKTKWRLILRYFELIKALFYPQIFISDW